MLHTLKAARQVRIIAEHRADTHHDRIMPGAHQMHLPPCFLACNHQPRPAGPCRKPVRRLRDLHRHQRPPVDHPPNEPAIDQPCLAPHHADAHRNPRRAQHHMPPPVHPRIGVFHRRDNADDPRLAHGIAAGRRLAVMRARLQRHRHFGAARRVPCHSECFCFGVRPAARLREAAPHNHRRAVRHPPDHRADCRIGPHRAEPPPRERQRVLHHARIESIRRHPLGPGSGSSAVNSSSRSSKSFASRKFR